MDYRGLIKDSLEETITSEKEAFKLETLISTPACLAARVTSLLTLFRDLYLETEEAQLNLLYDAQNRPHILEALFDSIYETAGDLREMLEECSNYVEQNIENKAD